MPTILLDSALCEKDMAEELQQFTFSKFQNLMKTWFKNGRMVWYVSGNISKEESLEMVG